MNATKDDAEIFMLRSIGPHLSDAVMFKTAFLTEEISHSSEEPTQFAK